MPRMTVRARGCAFECSIDGKAGRPWIVTGNSLATNLSLWDVFVSALGTRYRIFRYDQRGHGGSSVPPPPYAMADLAEDVPALMDAVGIDRAHYVGISMGGAAGWRLAQRWPGRFASVTICNSVVAATSAAEWSERLEVVRSGGLGKLVEPTLSRWFTKQSVAADTMAVRLVREMILATPVDGFVGCVNALQAFDFSGGVEDVTMPMLLVAGAQDGNKPQTMAADAGRVAGAALSVVPDAGHLCNIENPPAFNAIVGGFIDSVEACAETGAAAPATGT